MSLFNVTWDVAPLVLNYIDTNWGQFAESDQPSKPERIRLVTEDENGNPVKGWDPASYDYILISESGERSMEPIDGPRDAYDLSATANVRITTPTSRARRTALYEELLVLAKHARKRSDATPGNWDTVDYEPINVPDEDFRWWHFEGAWVFRAEARTI